MATKLQFLAILIIAATSSSFTIINAEDSSKSEEHIDKGNAASEITNNQEDSSKAAAVEESKRSQEEILFGNQQNRPGLVDDMMGMAEREGENNTPNDKANDSAQTMASDDSPKDEFQPRTQDDPENEMMLGGPNQEEPWYKAMPVSSSAMQYLANAQAMKNMQPDPYSAGGLYDQEELYRRKRGLMGGRPRRSLRSSLGQMIQKRGIRLPRRSMRLKRNVDMEDLLNMIDNQQRYYGEEEQQVPGRFSGYPETPASEYRYPYVFQHRGDGILSAANDLEDNGEAMEGDAMEDIDNLMMLPPNARYMDMGLAPSYGGRDEEKDVIQKWLSRHTVPSVYRVQRRSSPYFYPIDYRYMPGYKKRSSFMANRPEGRFGVEEEQPESEFGKWGHVVQVPEAYANPEDIARLYGLANLMAAEGEDQETRIRRAA